MPPDSPRQPWQYRVLDCLPPSIDEADLRASLQLTPTERLQRVEQMAALVAEADRVRHDRLR